VLPAIAFPLAVRQRRPGQNILDLESDTRTRSQVTQRPIAGVQSLFRAYAAGTTFISNLYLPRPSSCSSNPTGGPSMLDLVYLGLGLALFGLMSLYAHWAASA